MFQPVRTVAVIAALSAASCAAARAETLLGSNYAGGSFGFFQFGDDRIDDVVGTAYGVDGVGNLNLMPNLDLKLAVSYLWAEGNEGGVEIDMSGLAAGANLIAYRTCYRDWIHPFVGAGLSVVENETQLSSAGLSVGGDGTEVGFDAGAGVELELGEKYLLRVGGDYFYIDDDDDVNLSATLGYWLSSQVLATVRGTYAIDSENTALYLGLRLKL